jgi:hypothetical protein
VGANDAHASIAEPDGDADAPGGSDEQPTTAASTVASAGWRSDISML